MALGSGADAPLVLAVQMLRLLAVILAGSFLGWLWSRRAGFEPAPTGKQLKGATNWSVALCGAGTRITSAPLHIWKVVLGTKRGGIKNGLAYDLGAFDLDGTVLRRNLRITQETITAMQRLREQGDAARRGHGQTLRGRQGVRGRGSVSRTRTP